MRIPCVEKALDLENLALYGLAKTEMDHLATPGKGACVITAFRCVGSCTLHSLEVSELNIEQLIFTYIQSTTEQYNTPFVQK